MVRFLQKTTQLLLLAILFAGSLTTIPGTAWAQRPGVNDKIMEVDTSKSYMLPYALVVLGVVLGVMIVARPGTRQEEAKLRSIDDDDE